MLLTGFCWCAFLVGIVFGGIGNHHEAYTGSLGSVIVGISMTFVPLVIGIHVGVSYVRDEECKKEVKADV